MPSIDLSDEDINDLQTAIIINQDTLRNVKVWPDIQLSEVIGKRLKALEELRIRLEELKYK